jgi:predicted small lipoprotein YifL
MNVRLRKALVLVGLAATLAGCGREAPKNLPTNAEIEARAKAAADAQLAQDSAAFRDIVEGRGPRVAAAHAAATPAPAAAESTSDVTPGVAAPAMPPSAVGAPAASLALDDTADGREARRLLAAYVERLSFPERARFRNVWTGSFYLPSGKAYGVCGEVNPDPEGGGRFRGFVTWHGPDGADRSASPGADKLQQMEWEAYAKGVGCLKD